MKKLFFLLFLVCTLNAVGQETPSKTIMIKAIETYGSFVSMNIALHTINEKGELTTKELSKHNTKGIPENMLVVKKELDSFLSIGYKIISTSAVSFGWNGVFTIENTYILEK